MPRYKIVETTRVTDEELERIVNDWVGQGWELDGFQFITHESSKRPKMAFVLFTTPSEDEYDEEEDEELENEGQTN